MMELKRIREREANKLKIENKKMQQVRKLDAEKQKLILDIKRIKRARMRDKLERRAKASRALIKIKKTGRKVGKKVIAYLQRVRDAY